MVNPALKHRKNTFTLAELLLAIALFSIIVLAAFAFNTSSTYFLKSTDLKAEVLNEATRIMEHISKNARCAHGNTDFPGIALSADTIQIRQDIIGCSVNLMPAGQIPSPENYENDTMARYKFDQSSHEVLYYPEFNSDPGKVEVLSRKLVSVAITAPETRNANSFVIKTVLMKIPGQPEDVRTNPRVEMETRIYGYGVSLN